MFASTQPTALATLSTNWCPTVTRCFLTDATGFGRPVTRLATTAYQNWWTTGRSRLWPTRRKGVDRPVCRLPDSYTAVTAATCPLPWISGTILVPSGRQLDACAGAKFCERFSLLEIPRTGLLGHHVCRKACLLPINRHRRRLLSAYEHFARQVALDDQG